MHVRKPIVGGDPTGCFEAITARHADVHEDHVRSVLSGKRHGLAAVGGFGQHGDVVLGIEQGTEPSPDQCLVIGEYDANHWSSLIGIQARTRNPPSGLGPASR